MGESLHLVDDVAETPAARPPPADDFGVIHGWGSGTSTALQRTTIARIDAAYGDEGWRLTFCVNAPFRFSRIGKRTAPLPFVP